VHTRCGDHIPLRRNRPKIGVPLHNPPCRFPSCGEDDVAEERIGDVTIGLVTEEIDESIETELSSGRTCRNIGGRLRTDERNAAEPIRFEITGEAPNRGSIDREEGFGPCA
jgi:hypothetical protein